MSWDVRGVIVVCSCLIAAGGCLAPSYSHLPPCEAHVGGDQQSAMLLVRRTAAFRPPVLHLLDGRPYVFPRSSHAQLECNHQYTQIAPGHRQLDFAWQVTGGSLLVAGGKILWYASSVEFDAAPAHTYELVVEKRLFVGFVCELIDQTMGTAIVSRGEPGSQCGDPETPDVYRRILGAYRGACSPSLAPDSQERAECLEPWFVSKQVEE
jgi:hypothetical protein